MEDWNWPGTPIKHPTVSYIRMGAGGTVQKRVSYIWPPKSITIRIVADTRALMAEFERAREQVEAALAVVFPMSMIKHRRRYRPISKWHWLRIYAWLFWLSLLAFGIYYAVVRWL